MSSNDPKPVMNEETVARNLLHMRKLMPIWMRNIRRNSCIIERYYHSHHGTINIHDIASRFSSPLTDQTLILASGYSLLQSEHYVSTFPGLIIATPTNLPWCLKIGRVPHVVLISDPNDAVAVQLECVNDLLPTTNFIVPTTVSTTVLQLLEDHQCTIYFYNPFVADPTGNIKNQPFNEYLNYLFADLGIGYLIQVGCVTNSAVLLADRIINPSIKAIYLVGADYSFTDDNHSRVPMYHYNRDAIQNAHLWTEVPGEPTPQGHYEHPLYHVRVTDALIAYKRTLMTLWYSGKFPLAVVNPKGILRELPYIPNDDDHESHLENISNLYTTYDHEHIYEQYLNTILPHERYHHEYSKEGDR